MTRRDGAEERALSRRAWARRSAAWERSSADTGIRPDRHSEALIAAAAIAPGRSVVDIATGMGEPALAIARCVGAAGAVTCVDQSPEMLAGARRRAAELGLEGLRYVIADMVELPFADAAFDALTCRSGIMGLNDRTAALREARRVLRPGAKAAYMVWGPAEDNTAYNTVRAAVLRHFGRQESGWGPKRHSLGATGAVAGLLEGAGFIAVEEQGFRETTEVPVTDPFWRSRLERSFADDLAGLDAGERAALEKTVAEAFERHRDGDFYRLVSHTRIGVGTAPS